jgi:hypothetical protein
MDRTWKRRPASANSSIATSRSATGSHPRTDQARAERVAERRRVTGRARQRHGRVCRAQAGVSRSQQLPERDGGAGPRPGDQVLVVEAPERFAQQVERHRVARFRPHAEVALVGLTRRGQQHRIVERARQIGDFERQPSRRIHVAAGPDGPRQVGEHPRAQRRRFLDHPVDRFECTFVDRDGVVDGQPVARLAARGTRVVHRLIGDAGGRGLAVVVGQLGIRRTGTLDERIRDLTMEPDPTVGAELVEQGRTHQRVREGHPSEPALDLVDEPSGQGLVEPVDGLVIRATDHRGDDIGIELASDHRRDAQDPVHVLRETRQATSDDVAHALGQTGSPAGTVPTQSPSRCTRVPVSIRWRSTSRTKNGLPSVSSTNRRANRKPLSSRS